jgi:cysteine-rich repeat protein
MANEGEQCDDGNNVSCDGCSKICLSEACGNGIRECAEVCDDGGTLACDGECATDCSRTVDVCGDGITECSEECDAGAANGTPGSACSGFCKTCAVGSGADCPCGTDFDCSPAGRCGGLACLSGACSSVDVPVCDDGNACNGVETCSNGECVVTPTVCADDDPCTDDTCTPAGGCPHPRKTGFAGVDCRLELIERLATDASVTDLPTKERGKILKLVGGARTRIITAGQETRLKRQKKLLKASEKQISKLVKLVGKGLKKKKIGAALGMRLQTESDGARTDARSLRAALTG